MVTLDLKEVDRHYEEGLLLLTKHSKNRVLLQNLSKKKNAAKLKYELEKVLKAMPKAEAPKAPQQSNFKPPKPPKPPKSAKSEKVAPIRRVPRDENLETKKIIRDGNVIDVDQLPGDIRKLWDQNRDAYKQMRALHEKSKLMDNASVEDRGVLTGQLADLDDLVRDNWAVIDAWDPDENRNEKNGQSNEKIDHKRINANRKFISTNLKKLQAGINEKKAEIIIDNLKIRVGELKDAGEEMDQKTLDELSKFGI
jgi:hypothetical protein